MSSYRRFSEQRKFPTSLPRLVDNRRRSEQTKLDRETCIDLLATHFPHPTSEFTPFKESTITEEGVPVCYTKDDESMSDSCEIMFQQRRVTNFQASMHILKISIGSGILAMPVAVRDNGLLIGCVGIILISMLMSHTCNLLIKCSSYLRHRPHLMDEKDNRLSNELTLDYAYLVYYCVRLGPPPIRRHVWLASLVQGLLIYAQFGTLCVYTLFLAQNLKYWLGDYYSWFDELSLIWYLVFVTALLFMLVFVKTLHHLALFSVLANICGIVSLLLCIIYCVTHLSSTDDVTSDSSITLVDLPLTTSVQNSFLLFGVVVYAFETINILIPLEEQMIEPDSLGGLNGVMNTSMFIAIAMYVAVGFYGYVCFKDQTQSTIIFSMPTQPWYWMLSKPLYIFTFFVTYSLQFYVLFQILWDKFIHSHLSLILKEKLFLFRSMKKSRFLWIADAFLRVSLVLICFSIATVVPRVDLLIALVGASSGMGLSLIFPSLSHLCITWHSFNEDIKIVELSSWQKFKKAYFVYCKNGTIIFLGVFGLLLGTFFSLKDLLNNFIPNS